MRITVTVVHALPEATMQRLVVRQAMAILATGSGGMWPLVTVNTVYPAVIGDCLREIPGFLNVTYQIIQLCWRSNGCPSAVMPVDSPFIF